MAEFQKKEPKKNTLIYNLLFLLICGGLFSFLWIAPPETTAPLPRNETHAPFMKMKKKEAEKHCEECHSADQTPLPAEHPQPYRCLFCHKRK